MVKEVFEFNDYRRYLIDTLDAEQGRGKRSRLAEALNCQPAFVSRVLKGEADFSQEHAVVINSFFSHRDEEANYFMALLDYSRAGTKSLKDFHWKKLQDIKSKRQIVSERIGIKENLSDADQMTYYSAWYYAAVHILLMIPEMRSSQRLAERLKLPIPLIKDILEFLINVGLVVSDQNGISIGRTRIHLKSDSPMISKHHINWRLRAMQMLENRDAENLNYSGPICISREVAAQMKEMILKFLTEAEPLIKGAKDEEVYCLDIDFFKV